MIIAITNFKLKNLFKKIRLLSYAVPLFRLARKSPGNVHAGRFTHQCNYHTVSACGNRGMQ